MPIEFTRKGFIEVWRGDQKISQHTNEREALETITEHHAVHGDGDYEIRSPLVVAKAYGVLPPGGDTTPPSTPGSVQAVALSATVIRVTWTASTDNIAVTGYQIFRDGTPLTTTTELTFDDTGRTPSTQYSYTVTAFDAAGNNSTAGGPALATTNANSAPVWSQGNQSFDNGDGVFIGLDGVCSDADGDPITYSLVSGTLPTGLALSGARNQTLSGTVTADGVYNFTLGASDGIAAVQNVALTFTVTTPDVTAPDAPSAPTINTFTSSTITLNLPTSAAGDHAGYQVWRSLTGTGGSFGNRSGATLVTASTFQDTGLNASTAYYYALVDVDTSSNASALGASVSQTTAAASALPYDLTAGGTRTPPTWVTDGTFEWPDPPVTTSTVNVPADMSLATAIGTGARLINITSGTHSGIRIVQNDIDIVMADSVVISGVALGFRGTDPDTRVSRIRITGGNITATGDAIDLDSCTDVIFDNVNITNTANGASNGFSGGDPATTGRGKRVAVLNSTMLLQNGSVGSGWNVYISDSTAGSSNAQKASDYLFANVKFGHIPTSGTGQITRMMGVDRLLVVDSYFGYTHPTLTGGRENNAARFHNESNYSWIADTISARGFAISLVGDGGHAYSMSNSTIERVTSYGSFAAIVIASDTSGTSVVRDSIVYTTGGDEGSAPSVGSYTDGGGNTSIAWDGSTYPSHASYGADH